MGLVEWCEGVGMVVWVEAPKLRTSAADMPNQHVSNISPWAACKHLDKLSQSTEPQLPLEVD